MNQSQLCRAMFPFHAFSSRLVEETNRGSVFCTCAFACICAFLHLCIFALVLFCTCVFFALVLVLALVLFCTCAFFALVFFCTCAFLHLCFCLHLCFLHLCLYLHLDLCLFFSDILSLAGSNLGTIRSLLHDHGQIVPCYQRSIWLNFYLYIYL